MDPHAPAQPVSFNNEGGRFAIQTGVYENYGQTIVNQTSSDDLERRLPHAVDAPFNAYVRQHEPFCLLDTRTVLLEEMYDWAEAQDERCVYWLNGLAGTGKSTIARTVARRLNDQGSLGASFFFSKGGGDIGRARKFATSIAFQLAISIPLTRQHIWEAVSKFPNISNLSLRDQWRHLVLQPLAAVKFASTVVLVIDALDECDDDDDIGEIIQLLAEPQDLSGLRLRTLLTSRPEVPIRHGFGLWSDELLQRYVLHGISSEIVDADIALFLKQKLTIIGSQQHLHTGWPGPEMIAKMTRRANGLFIWAATAYKFIQQGRRFAEQRLESITEQDDDSPVEPEKQLHNIYTTVLRASIFPEYTASEREEHCNMLRLVLGSLAVLAEPLTVQALGSLLKVGTAHIERTVQGLHAILDIPEERHCPLRLHHPSFRDFLFDYTRCTDVIFCIDEAQAHLALLSQCDELMIRFVQQEQEFDEKIGSPNNSEWTLQSIPMEVQYACLNFLHHYARASKRNEKTQVRCLLEDSNFIWKLIFNPQCLEEDHRLRFTLEALGAVRAELNPIDEIFEHHQLD